MMSTDREMDTRAVLGDMQRTRDELRALFEPYGNIIEGKPHSVFPRSRTFRWLLNHPIGRLTTSALVSGVLSRLPIGRILARRASGKNR